MNIIHFALIGCGRISKKHIEAINQIDNAKLIAVCDIAEDRAKAVADSLKIPYYTDYKEMLDKEKDIDVVNILTPSGTHAKITIDIAKYKKHIIVEKPMALRLEDADEMIKVCDENNIKLFVVKQNRYNLAVQKLRKAIEKTLNAVAKVDSIRSGIVLHSYDKAEVYIRLYTRGIPDHEELLPARVSKEIEEQTGVSSNVRIIVYPVHIHRS